MEQAHLTQPDPKLAERIKATPPGMAYWAGTGPAQATCGQCRHFRGTPRHAGIGVGKLNDGPCALYRRMVKNGTCRWAAVLPIPAKTSACREFEQKGEAQ